MEKSPDKPFWNIVVQNGHGYVFEEKDWKVEVFDDKVVIAKSNDGTKHIRFPSPMIVEYVGD